MNPCVNHPRNFAHSLVQLFGHEKIQSLEESHPVSSESGAQLCLTQEPLNSTNGSFTHVLGNYYGVLVVQAYLNTSPALWAVWETGTEQSNLPGRYQGPAVPGAG